MKVSTKGALEIAEHEGIVPAPYYDSVGVLTYLIGHTKNAGGVDPADVDMAMPTGAALTKAIDLAITLFKEDLNSYERRINAAFPMNLAQHEFDALVSMDFNTGMATWRSKKTGQPAAVVRHMKAGNRTKAAQAFMGWLRPPELRKRRTAEMNLFITGDYDGNGDDIPVWKTNGAGKLIGITKTLRGRDLVKRLGKKSPIDLPDDAQEMPAQHRPPVSLLQVILKILNAIFGGKKK